VTDFYEQFNYPSSYMGGGEFLGNLSILLASQERFSSVELPPRYIK
jgi:hypothetical protein